VVVAVALALKYLVLTTTFVSTALFTLLTFVLVTVVGGGVILAVLVLGISTVIVPCWVLSWVVVDVVGQLHILALLLMKGQAVSVTVEVEVRVSEVTA